jgi:hypothetical protein
MNYYGFEIPHITDVNIEEFIEQEKQRLRVKKEEEDRRKIPFRNPWGRPGRGDKERPEPKEEPEIEILEEYDDEEKEGKKVDDKDKVDVEERGLYRQRYRRGGRRW